MRADVAVVGGGPAGLAAAIAAARRGLDVVVLEKRDWPIDKACGEGLMPGGVAALERLGVRAHLDPDGCAPFAGIRYLQEDGAAAEARFAGGSGLGIRRLALMRALTARAGELGVRLRRASRVRSHRRTPDGVGLALDGGDEVHARLLVAADGLGSPLRRAEGLALDRVGARGPRRFGLRQHFAMAPFSPFVEVRFSHGIEAYVTPAGPGRVGVAFLWDDAHAPRPLSFAALLQRFPALGERLRGAPADSEPRGAGPLLQLARARTADRFVLVGDAAGYIDAITGEGLSLAFHGAEALGAVLPEALARGATRAALAPYERASARAFARYARLTHGLLLLSRRPGLRRAVVRGLGRHPRLFAALLGWATRPHALAAPDRSTEPLLCAGTR